MGRVWGVGRVWDVRGVGGIWGGSGGVGRVWVMGRVWGYGEGWEYGGIWGSWEGFGDTGGAGVKWGGWGYGHSSISPWGAQLSRGCQLSDPQDPTALRWAALGGSSADGGRCGQREGAGRPAATSACDNSGRRMTLRGGKERRGGGLSSPIAKDSKQGPPSRPGRSGEPRSGVSASSPGLRAHRRVGATPPPPPAGV